MFMLFTSTKVGFPYLGKSIYFDFLNSHNHGHLLLIRLFRKKNFKGELLRKLIIAESVKMLSNPLPDSKKDISAIHISLSSGQTRCH